MLNFRKIFYLCGILSVIICILSGVYLIWRAYDDHETKDELKWLHLSRSSLFQVLPRSENEVIFLGASIIQHCEWAELLSNPMIKNRGISGDTTADVVERLSEVARRRPEKLFIMIGLNDLFQRISINETVSNYLKIVRYIKECAPGAQMYFFSILPVGKKHDLLGEMNSRIRELNAKLKEICEKEACMFIDLYHFFKNEEDFLREEFTHDGIHLNGAGYVLWKSVMLESSGW